MANHNGKPVAPRSPCQLHRRLRERDAPAVGPIGSQGPHDPPVDQRQQVERPRPRHRGHRLSRRDVFLSAVERVHPQALIAAVGQRLTVGRPGGGRQGRAIHDPAHPDHLQLPRALQGGSSPDLAPYDRHRKGEDDWDEANAEGTAST